MRCELDYETESFFFDLELTIAILGSSAILETTVMAATEPTWDNCLTYEAWTSEKQAWCMFNRGYTTQETLKERQ